MQSFTQTEIKWMIGALQEKARAYHEAARMADNTSNNSLDGSLYRLREEQFNAMACKLQKVLDGKSRRVEITL